jgi:zinc D-Ala-D-Ala dipeptidase
MLRWIVFIITTLFLTNAVANSTKPIPFPQLLKQSKQLIVVTTASWSSKIGKLQLFQRKNYTHKWQPVGKSFQTTIGDNGIGWDLAYKKFFLTGPYKKEGDNKSPAGIFSLGSVFGFNSKPNKSIKSPYLPITKTTVCIDDSNSKYYNQEIDSAKIQSPDWKSLEPMRKVTVYRKGIIINYNKNHPKPNAGSCVFIHIWDNSSSGTAGCTAMSETNINKLIYWLNPIDKPVLVQLPKNQYDQLKKAWELPDLRL